LCLLGWGFNEIFGDVDGLSILCLAISTGVHQDPEASIVIIYHLPSVHQFVRVFEVEGAIIDKELVE
jgi:hypothetical protein